MAVKYKENKELLIYFFKSEIMCVLFVFETKFVFNGLLVMAATLKKHILLCIKLPPQN